MGQDDGILGAAGDPRTRSDKGLLVLCSDINGPRPEPDNHPALLVPVVNVRYSY